MARARRQVTFYGTPKSRSSTFLPAERAGPPERALGGTHPRYLLLSFVKSRLEQDPAASLVDLTIAANLWLRDARRENRAIFADWLAELSDRYVAGVVAELRETGVRVDRNDAPSSSSPGLQRARARAGEMDTRARGQELLAFWPENHRSSFHDHLQRHLQRYPDATVQHLLREARALRQGSPKRFAEMKGSITTKHIRALLEWGTNARGGRDV